MSSDDSNRATPVALETRMAIATPEGVEVELTLAGIGSRFMAGALDYTIQIVVIVAMALILQPAGGAGAAIFTSASFAMIFFYDVLFEVLGGGRTPGKRVNGLRVVRSGGRPITFSRSALRNILRLIDILPGMYAVGMIVMFISPRNQRVGDLAAGSYVVRDRIGGPARPHRMTERPEVDTTPAQTWDVTAISAEDVATVRAFLERRYDLNDESRRAIGRELAARLRPRVGGVPTDVHDEQFLELLVAVKRR
jgi:uncharacterized RDD family membrane protein YckC